MPHENILNIPSNPKERLWKLLGVNHGPGKEEVTRARSGCDSLGSPTSACFICFRCVFSSEEDFLGGAMVKNLSANTGDMSLIPGLGSSLGEGNGYPLQYSCLEHPMDRAAWRAAVHGVAKSQKWLSTQQATLLKRLPFKKKLFLLLKHFQTTQSV